MTTARKPDAPTPPPARRATTLDVNSPGRRTATVRSAARWYSKVHVCMCVSACVCLCVCVRLCVCECVGRCFLIRGEESTCPYNKRLKHDSNDSLMSFANVCAEKEYVKFISG